MEHSHLRQNIMVKFLLFCLTKKKDYSIDFVVCQETHLKLSTCFHI